jgi:glyceraldehyde-3-phosphate dehydrogenase (NADP+)
VIGEVAEATEADLDGAIAAAQAAFEQMRALPRHARHAILARVSQSLADQRESWARDITQGSGKPIRQARAEVDRAVITFSLAAEEARRIGGEVVPLDLDPRAVGMTGVMHRFPIGPISAISPFNFPLNLLAHKVGPALAVGSALVVKPPPQCPQPAFRLASLLAEAGLPAGAYNVLHLPIPLAERLATDPRFGLLTFTGSPAVGWHLKAVAGRKKVLLELGGDAAAIVHHDARDLERIAQRLAVAAFGFGGQVCIRVQRLLVHASIYQDFMPRFLAAARSLPVGDPLDEATVVGPLIDQAAADRVEAWVEEAISGGAVPLVRAPRTGNCLGPVILEQVPPDAKVSRLEIFGPVVTLATYHDWNQAIAAVNASAFGLQAGVFTQDLDRIFAAFEALEVGGVIANDVPTLRVDNYPYGGVKDSGFGREGVRYAMEAMTEPRMLVLNLSR